MAEPDEDVEIKVVLMGDSCADFFSELCQSSDLDSLGASVGSWRVEINGKTVKVNIWDIGTLH